MVNKHLTRTSSAANAATGYVGGHGLTALAVAMALVCAVPAGTARAQSQGASMPTQAPPLPVGVGQQEPEKRTWWGGTTNRTTVPAGMPTQAPAITQKDLQKLQAAQPPQVAIADPLLESVAIMETRLPAASEAQLGERMAQAVLSTSSLHPDLALQGYVNDLGRWLSLHGPRHDRNWTFGVLADAQSKAYALPGGYVFVTQGLLERVNDESTLAGLLAQQIALSTQGGLIRTLAQRVVASPQADMASHTRQLLAEPIPAQVLADADGLAYVMLSGAGFAAGTALQPAIRLTAADVVASNGLFRWLRGAPKADANANGPSLSDRLGQIRAWDARNPMTDAPSGPRPITISQRLRQMADAGKTDMASAQAAAPAMASNQPALGGGDEPGFFKRWWNRVTGK